MKKYISCFLIGLAVVLFASCEGPQGPPGPAMDATCQLCHNSVTSNMSAIQVQFDNGAHAVGTYYNRDGECAACHNTEGFLARQAHGSNLDSIKAFTGAKSAISCYTCHNVHRDYDVTDYELTYTDQVTSTIFGTTSADHAAISFADYGNSNLCLQCHQARDRGNVPGSGATADVEVSKHWGPHYGVQGNVLHASGGVNVTGSESYPNATAGHAGIENACISCHMHEGNHSLTVDFDNACASCHGTDIEDKYDDLHDEIDELKHHLGRLLASQGAMVALVESQWVWDGADHVEQIDTVGFEPVGGYGGAAISADLAKGVYNYMVVYQDHSYGAHNPSYIRALLENSIELVSP